MANDLIKEIETQIVQTESLFSVDEEFTDERFMKVRIAAMHSGINRNNSRFSVDTILAAKESFANIPVLADVRKYTDKDGNDYLDYSGHTMHIETDAFDETKERLIYDEKVVGVVPEKNNFELIKNEENGNTYVWIDALLYRDYGNYVCDILNARDGKTDVSMEIHCDDCSFSAKDKVLDVGIMQAAAVTLLGEHVVPGMKNAHAEAFSVNSDRENQLISIMQELKQSLDNYTSLRKEETTKMQEVFEDENKKNVPDDDVVEEEVQESTPAEQSIEEDTPTTPEETENQDDNQENTSSDEDETFSKENLFNKLFEVSFDEIHYALNVLCSVYRNDDEWCYVTQVYDEYFIMMDWDNDKYYKQSYTRDGDNISLSGERIELFAMFLTESEKIAIESMRENYSKFEEVSAKLSKYEEEPRKMEVITSNDYAQIADLEEVKTFSNIESHFDMSIEEVKGHMDELLLNYAKSGNLNFSSIGEVKQVGMKHIPITKKKSGRYGNLFSK